MESLISKEEQEMMIAKGAEVVKIASSIVIKDNESYVLAGEILKSVKERRSEVMDNPTKPEKSPLRNKEKAHSVWKFLSEICNMVQKPFDDAERIIDRKMLDYRAEIERKRQEEIRKAEAKAREKAEAERKAEIARMKELGDKEAAKNLKDAPLEIKAVAPKTPEAPKISGIPIRKIWDFQVDINQLERRYMIPDMVAIRKVVSALGARHGIPGVTAFQKEIQ